MNHGDENNMRKPGDQKPHPAVLFSQQWRAFKTPLLKVVKFTFMLSQGDRSTVKHA